MKPHIRRFFSHTYHRWLWGVFEKKHSGWLITPANSFLEAAVMAARIWRGR